MLEAISSFIGSFLSEKLMQRKVKPWRISLLVTFVCAFLVFVYDIVAQGMTVKESLTPGWFLASVYGCLFLFLWGCVAYYYRKERRKGAESS